jgi:hypothetical protein
VCRSRLEAIAGKIQHRIISGSAFDPVVLEQLPLRGYDLVITNPPDVRYQAQNGDGGQGETSRSGLLTIVERYLSGAEREVWSTLASGYSGLADLSVPAWLLAAVLVRPGGRLALVVPATWRSRDYGDVIRYLLLRCFQLDYIIEDTQPGWFSDALVRTHLIIATRLPLPQICEPLEERRIWPTPHWVLISPPAASSSSLVGAAFAGDTPDADFGQWLFDKPTSPRVGIQVRAFDLEEEYSSLRSRAARRPWYRILEGSAERDLPLFASHRRVAPATNIPEAVRDILGDTFPTTSLSTLEEAGIRVGQGLRTGCNAFFYVEMSGESNVNGVKVKSSPTYGAREFMVPSGTLRPVLRRQADLAPLENGEIPIGRVLDLRHWVLPEDVAAVAEAASTYRTCGETRPEVMPEELAAYVRLAATFPIEDRGEGKPAPELSAVRTNVRGHRQGAATPRFWYMLPDFAPRHLPSAFVPRVIGGAPWVEMNLNERILIDANFSSFWSSNESWSGPALKALLNSAWCKLLMEALGTTLGGGALKLEAAHLKTLPIPILSKAAKERLHVEGAKLRRDSGETHERINAIVFKALCEEAPIADQTKLATLMIDRAETFRRMRQRNAA